MPAWLVPALFAAGQAVIQGIQAKRQARHNKELAQFQADADRAAIDRQNAYNTPMSQMQRFQQAGLNANLIYGQGNPGNQQTAQRYPDIRPADFQSIGADVMANLNQSRLMQSQTAALDQRTVKDGVLTDLARLQKSVLSQNPLLHGALEPIIESLKLTASLKEQQFRGGELGIQQQQQSLQLGEQEKLLRTLKQAEGQENIRNLKARRKLLEFQLEAGETMLPVQLNKVHQEIENLSKQYNLQGVDMAIRAEILKSREFQNELLRIQRDFVVDGDIGPSQIYQFIQELIMLAGSRIKPR